MDNNTGEFFYEVYKNFLLRKICDQVHLMMNLPEDERCENHREFSTKEFWQKEPLIERHAFEKFLQVINEIFCISGTEYQQFVTLRHKNLSPEFQEAQDWINKELDKARQESKKKRGN